MNQVLKSVRSASVSNGNGQVSIATNQAFPQMLEKFKGEIARALPRHINPDRMARIALTAFRMNPGLAKCQPTSIFAAVIQSCQLGLEVGLMGEAYLVPFRDQCQLIPGYQGLIKLARQSGLVKDIYAHEVREKDDFDVVLGLDRTLRHVPKKLHGFPASDEERGEIVGFYAVAIFKDGSNTFVAMSKFDVEKIRDASGGYQSASRYGKQSLWDKDFLSMGLKTAIRRLCKYLPKSPEMATALALDARSESGKDQGLKIDDVINGEFIPVDDVEDVSRSEGISGNALGDILALFDSAKSLEELDDAYASSEGNLAKAELDTAVKRYQACRAKLSAKQGSFV